MSELRRFIGIVESAAAQTLPTPAALSATIRETAQDYIQKGLAPNVWEINNGLCEDFAMEVLRRYGGERDGLWIYDAANFTVEGEGDQWDRKLLAKHWPKCVPTHGLTWKEADYAVPAHLWIVLGDRHYDAEAPDGVDNFFELPIIDSRMREIAANKAKKPRAKRQRPVDETRDVDLWESAELAMDTASRMERAKDMGFTIRAYHGTGAKFTAFDINKGRSGTTNGPAPHFADKKAEAKGYADRRKAEGAKARVMEVLLRVRNPLVVSYTKSATIPREVHERLVGAPYEGKGDPQATHTLSQMEYALARRDGMGFGGGDATNRPRWMEIYRRLSAEGYDAIFYPDTPADHSDGHYGKYIVWDPRNVRLVKAAFDPSKSDSTDLMS